MSYDVQELHKAHGRPKWKSLPKHQYTELKPKAEVTFTEYREPFRVPRPDDDPDEDDLDLDDLNDLDSTPSSRLRRTTPSKRGTRP